MAFDGYAPTAGDALDAEPIRNNFQALAAHHRAAVAPTAPLNGYIWWDSSDSTNEKLRGYFGSSWVTLFTHMESTPVPANGAASAFTALTDTPAAYTGEAGNNVVVNAAADGLEFAAAPSATFTALTDTPAAYTGEGGKIVAVNAGATALEFVASSGGTGLQTFDIVYDDANTLSWDPVAVSDASVRLVAFQYWVEALGGGTPPIGAVNPLPPKVLAAGNYPVGFGTVFPDGYITVLSMTHLTYAIRSAVAQGDVDIKVTHPGFPTAGGVLALVEGSNYEFVTAYSYEADGLYPNYKLILDSQIQTVGGYSASAVLQVVTVKNFTGPWVVSDASGNIYFKREILSVANPPVRWHLRFFGFAG